MRHDAERLYVSLVLRQATIGHANPFVVQKGRNMLLHLSSRLMRALLIGAMAASLTGCGVVAFPVRTTSAAVKIVPVAGDVVAYPLDKTADAID
jgi:hypothetical protein